ncbi:MAG: AAA family ATPase [Kofleriaceae bacterium]|jgi:hypothetical protein|nr:AAA family ATPase [Kofleriaceae bacterium]
MAPNGNGNGNGRCRIVLTGGPGGGKTTAAALYRRELGERIVVVPEAATLLFAGGFPRSPEPHARASAQRAIFHVQRNVEDVQSALYPGRILLCDRGTVDGAVYWPAAPAAPGGPSSTPAADPDGFFAALGTTRARELDRYDAVLFFETAAVGGITIEGGNPARIENAAEAVALDHALRALWADHPRFVLVPHQASFLAKINAGLDALRQVVRELAPAV